MESRIEIEKLISRKGNSDETVFGNILFNLMTNLHQPYSEIIQMPLPLVLELNRLLQKQQKEMEKQNRRKR